MDIQIKPIVTEKATAARNSIATHLQCLPTPTNIRSKI